MGQAWCKEKSTKAQDSKSPLDRVFVRCAHRIYPGLKEEGSVLGGATQRVTSSEIGYAGSPPRAALLRGRSIDSVDRPFHPSEWVDVNLEVPCTPRASVVLSGQRRHGDPPKSNGPRSSSVATSAPVPPPRRRRRRERRPLPPKPGSGGDAADDESEHEPEPLYSKLTPTIAGKGLGAEDSDEEFAAIELILQKHSLENIRVREEASARPKNHSTTSLPNVSELLGTPRTLPKDAARRPPRHVKTGSLPRDAPLFPPQTPERTVFARRIEEDRAEDATTGYNSIRKDEAECTLEFGVGLETSTPIKVREQSLPRESTDDSETFKDESSESRVSASPSAEASVAQESSRRDEDVGYESRTDSHLFSDASVGRIFHGSDELSSGILRDAIVDSFEDSDRSHILVVPTVQRTISEESLPHEMLVDELDEDDEQQQQMQLEDERSSKDTSNEINSNGILDLDTPPLSPVSNRQPSPSDVVDSHESRSESSKREINTTAVTGNPTSITPSLMELEVALTDMLEKKDEREREVAEDKSSDKLPEPQIVPVKRGRGLEDVEDHPRVSPQPRKGEIEGREPSESRLIDFPRVGRPNPFNDLKSDDLEPPEKPNRLHRISLIEESVIDEPLLVPTPPRRRHRSKSNLNSSTESTEALHTYAVNDRLI